MFRISTLNKENLKKQNKTKQNRTKNKQTMLNLEPELGHGRYEELKSEKEGQENNVNLRTERV